MIKGNADCRLICEWCPSVIVRGMVLWVTSPRCEIAPHITFAGGHFKILGIPLFWSMFIGVIFWSSNVPFIYLFTDIHQSYWWIRFSALLITMFLNWTFIKWPTGDNLVLHVTCSLKENASPCWHEYLCLMVRHLLNEYIVIRVYIINISLRELD